ncbi:MAG: aldo/keto reductase [Acidimicrobiia bacterium]|nr:aldo/keto reductase [Acidimicrobiia bacterium]
MTSTSTFDDTFTIGERSVRRFGFGAMRITGDGIWGPPADHDESIAVLRRAVELGINLIDTADSYGPEVSENLIAEALYPYPEDLVIATKGGLVRPGPGVWDPDGRPEHLREVCEASLRRLKLDRIDLYQFHRPDPAVPFEDSVGTLAELRNEGKIANVGLSNVTVDELRQAQAIVPIVTVQNRYNIVERKDEDVLEACADEGLGFIPWLPINRDKVAKDAAIGDVAKAHGATPAQVALAWLLRHSPVILPIPGTSSVAHLEENVAAAHLQLSDEEMGRLDNAS